MKNLPLVLLVDDDPAHLRLLEILMIDLPYEFISADSAREALSVLRNHTPELVIMDINMPGLSGFDLAGRIRSVPRLKHTKVLLATSLIDKRTLETAKWEGVEAPLQKPLGRQQLLNRIRQALGEASRTELAPAA